MNWPTAEELLANAILYLIHGGQKDAALLLLSCEAEYRDNNTWDAVAIDLFGPREAYEGLKFTDEETWKASPFYEWASAEHDLRQMNATHHLVMESFKAVTPPGYNFQGLEIRVKYSSIHTGWRDELHELAHGRHIHNQGVEIPGIKSIPWNGLNFRSQSEIRIAAALEAAGVLFLPNCRGRVGLPQSRGPLEPDFLICHEGK